MIKIIKPTDLSKQLSINDQIQACIDASAAKYDGLISTAESQLRQLQQQLKSAIASCETIYNNEVAACPTFVIDPLCSVYALTKRNECVYGAQQSYGVCCTARLLGIPVGGPPCCQSGLCSCSSDLRDPDNIGPQVNKQKEIDNLKAQKEKEKIRCIMDASQYVVPPPISELVVPTTVDGWGFFDWYVWRRPSPVKRRKSPDLDPDIVNNPANTPYENCINDCWLQYNGRAAIIEQGLKQWNEDQAVLTSGCKKDADDEYLKDCPPGSLAVGCGPDGPKTKKRDDAKRECDNLAKSATDNYIKNTYNPAMISLSTFLDECFIACEEQFDSTPTTSA
jgi:hypothetical protein